jgi:hypothetical protein
MAIAQKLAPEWAKAGKHFAKKWKANEFENVALAKVKSSLPGVLFYSPPRYTEIHKGTRREPYKQHLRERSPSIRAVEGAL